MSSFLERTREEGCLSDLRLDQMIRDEMKEGAAAAARAHLVECAACRRRLATIQTFRTEFVTGLAGPGLAGPAGMTGRSEAADQIRAFPWRRSGSRWLAVGSGVLASGVAAMILLGTLGGPSVPWRSKGDGRLRLYVGRGESVRPAASGDTVAPGDTLQFTYTLAQRRYFALLERDGRGAVSAFFPDGPDLVPLAPGVNVSLPRSTLLDDTLGETQVIGVFCQRAQALTPLLESFRQNSVNGPSAPGCEVERFILDKRRI